MDAVPRATVIVPCFDEEAGIPMLIERLEHLQDAGGGAWEILFVDDGSNDRTLAVLLSAVRDHPWCRLVRHPTNCGLGAALRTGYAYARGPIVCTIDSDCTYPPERLPELVGLVEQGVDIATASAWHPASAHSEGSRIRIGLSRAVSSLYKGLVGQDVHTFTCLFRAYRRDVVGRIPFRLDGFASVAEIMLRGMIAGCRVGEVPMKLERRRFGQSKLKIGDAVVAHMALLTLTTSLVAAERWRAHRRSSGDDAPTGGLV
jgi:dolichol-phosphate mannosyltransferase